MIGLGRDIVSVTVGVVGRRVGGGVDGVAVTGDAIVVLLWLWLWLPASWPVAVALVAWPWPWPCPPSGSAVM